MFRKVIGLTGSSGAGKTTLAKALAEHTGIQFLPSVVSRVFKEHNLDPRHDYAFLDRLQIQQEILRCSVESYVEAECVFVTDRTPLDFACYMMADIARGTLEGHGADKCAEILIEFCNACFDAANKHFAVIVGVQTGLPIVSDGIRPTCKVYAEHINTLMLGFLYDERLATNRYFIGKSVLDLSDRLRILNNIKKVIEGSISKQNNPTAA